MIKTMKKLLVLTFLLLRFLLAFSQEENNYELLPYYDSLIDINEVKSLLTNSEWKVDTVLLSTEEFSLLSFKNDSIFLTNSLGQIIFKRALLSYVDTTKDTYTTVSFYMDNNNYYDVNLLSKNRLVINKYVRRKYFKRRYRFSHQVHLSKFVN
jgi:hypothetical protein